MTRRVGGAVLLAVLLLAGLTALALLARSGPSGALDPRSAAPSGSRALAVLLERRGVDLRTVTLPAQAAGAGRGATVLVPFPERLTEQELGELGTSGAIVVLVGPDQEALDALGTPLTARAPLRVEPRQAACALAAAENAGTVPLGGTTYSATGVRSLECYAGRGRAPLVALPDSGVVVLGTGLPLTNEALDEDGNAALAIGLLGTGDRLLWVLPDPSRIVDDGSQQPLTALLPPWVGTGSLQLLVAAAVLALWRGRRLGRPVPEALPVVVRSAEAAEGLGRLYRTSQARDRAAEILRERTRSTLARATGLPAPTRSTLVPAVSARSGRSPEQVDAVLFGAAPADDAALVRVADDLDALVGSTRGPGEGSTP